MVESVSTPPEALGARLLLQANSANTVLPDNAVLASVGAVPEYIRMMGDVPAYVVMASSLAFLTAVGSFTVISASSIVQGRDRRAAALRGLALGVEIAHALRRQDHQLTPPLGRQPVAPGEPGGVDRHERFDDFLGDGLERPVDEHLLAEHAVDRADDALHQLCVLRRGGFASGQDTQLLEDSVPELGLRVGAAGHRLQIGRASCRERG